MLILIGTVPTAYALNQSRNVCQLPAFAVSDQASAGFDRYAVARLRLDDPRDDL